MLNDIGKSPNRVAQDALAPRSSIDRLKRNAKLLRSQLGLNKTVKLSLAHTAVMRCIGRGVFEVFSGGEPPTPVFPRHIREAERKDYQRDREIRTLSEIFPQVELEKVIKLVSTWKLVHWPEADSTQTAVDARITADKSSLSAERHGQKPMGNMASRVLPEHIDSEGGALSSIVTPLPVERFMPPSFDFAFEKAVALAKIADTSSLAFAYYVTARVFGYGSWADLEESFRLASRSEFDEELSSDASTRRRKWQAETIAALFSVDRRSAIELRSFWKPTSSSITYAGDISWSTRENVALPTEARKPTRIHGKLSVKARTTA